MPEPLPILTPPLPWVSLKPSSVHSAQPFPEPSQSACWFSSLAQVHTVWRERPFVPAEPIACRLEGERESAVLCVRWELEPGTKSRKRGGAHTLFICTYSAETTPKVGPYLKSYWLKKFPQYPFIIVV